MTTRRNNMFYARGACSAYSTIMSIMKEIKDDDERIKQFNKMYEAWLRNSIGSKDGIAYAVLDSATIVNKFYYVTVKDGQYIILDEISSSKYEKMNRFLFWNSNTMTNYIIDIVSENNDCYVTDFIDDDDDFIVNLSRLIGFDLDETESVDNTFYLRFENSYNSPFDL